MEGVIEMPGGDRTGPRGGGPKTGRGLGYCADNDQPGWAAQRPGPALGLGYRWGGRGRCRGRGRSNRWVDQWPGGWRDVSSVSPDVKDQGLDDLRRQAQVLHDALQDIKERLDRLET